MTLEDLGYNSFFESKKKELNLSDFSVARVTAEHKGLYEIKNERGEFLARITGRQIFKASGREDYPAVGDWVFVREIGGEEAVIKGILSRATVIKRIYADKIQIIASNVDTAFVIESVDRDYNLNRFERYFSIIENGGVKPAIILNKIDILTDEETASLLDKTKKRFPEIEIIMTSAKEETGLDNLMRYMFLGKTYCFLGSSGVGKSSLINKLLGKKNVKTGEISSYSGRGKHVTTSRQMYFLQNGAIVIDNPGMREVGIADAGGGVDSFFEEITAFSKKCKFSDCTHTHEPGCEVLKSVNSGEIEEEQYSNYVALKKESDFYEMSDFEKKEKDRKLGKIIKRFKKDIKNFDY